MILTLGHRSAWTADLEPLRYRAIRRRRMRAALRGAAILAAVVAAVSGAVIALRVGPAVSVLIGLSAGQAVLSVVIAATVRGPLRRYPNHLAFVFLLVVPIVPLITIRVEPEAEGLIAASLALIPVVVALILPWPCRIHRVWSACYLAVLALGIALGATSSLTVLEAWELFGGIVIGTAFGVYGQARRERQDREAFDRERELDLILGREVRGRESIEAALGRIDPRASANDIAAAVCRELVKLPAIDAAWVVALDAGHGYLLADAGRGSGLPAGTRIPDAWTQRLLARSSGGAWADWYTNRGDGGELVDPIVSGLLRVAWAPLRGAAGLVGLIGAGSYDRRRAERLDDLLPVIRHYGTIVGAIVGPELERRIEASEAREKVRDVLERRAYRPVFQPIVDLATGQTVGAEALTRFEDGMRPDLVFQLAATSGLGVELELATLMAAIGASAVLPVGIYLGLNASPELIHRPEFRELLAAIERPVVVEITEHVAIDDYEGLRCAVEALGPSVRLAVDDAGAGYASLRHILELAPSLVKIDIGLVRGIDADPARQALVAGIAYFAVKRTMRLVAEGIETPTELATLRSVGVEFGQGYLLGRPDEAQAVASSVAIPRALDEVARLRVAHSDRLDRLGRSNPTVLGATA